MLRCCGEGFEIGHKSEVATLRCCDVVERVLKNLEVGCCDVAMLRCCGEGFKEI